MNNEPTTDPSDGIPDHIDMPAPTVWPMVTAFGLTLLLAGLVTHWFISICGLVAIVWGAIGWWREVLPHARHAAVPVVPLEKRVKPIEPDHEKVSGLKLGAAGHRVRVPAEIYPYAAGFKGGLVGAAVMAVFACAYGLIAYGSIWYPINLLSASAVPFLADADLETLKAFSLTGLIVGIVAHLTMSIGIGLLYAVSLPMFPRFAWLWAGIITPLFWSGIVYATIGLINPNLEQHIDWVWFIICQVAFGMTCGYVVFKSEKVETMQTWPLVARLGFEADYDRKKEDKP